MALVTQQVQGCYATFPPNPVPWNRGIESKQFVATLHMVGRANRFILLKCKSCLCAGAPLVLGSKGKKSFEIFSFRGISQYYESGGRGSGSKSLKNSVKLSYVPQDSEGILIESPNVSSEANETMEGSLDIRNLFRKWLALLHTPSPNQVGDVTLEGPSSGEILKTQNGSQDNERSEILKAVWCFCLDLDATIKTPLMIFSPLYLAVNIIYGAQVSKELTPLWVFGPLIVALYIKIFWGLCALYDFSFKQIVKVVHNVPSYYLFGYNYIASGKLKQDTRAHLWQPAVDIKNLDYKAASKGKMKDLEGWLVDRYLDFLESIWPYYCRTVRFMKRANLI